MSKCTFARVFVVVAVLSFLPVNGLVYASLIENGDFENGLDGWASVLGHVQVIDTGVPGYGNVAKLNDSNSRGYEVLGQTFFIPVGTEQLTVSFDYLFKGTDDNSWWDDSVQAYVGYKDGDSLRPFSSLRNWNVERILDVTSSSDLFNTQVHFSTTIDINGLVDHNPNGAISFWLAETPCYTNTALFVDNVEVNAVPIPSAFVLLGTGIVSLVAVNRGRRKK